jgi:two-component system phosphate regulon sensor histidine kinase PhoR
MQARVEVEPGAERIYADPGRLEQVLVNLVDNAFKYTQEGGQVRVAWEKGPGGGVRLRVADNGPGIPEESRARIFERFYRVDKARSREVGGTGLGLSIVKHIVQRHGGSVELRSAPGQGTEFLCDFPGPEGT